MFVFLVGWLVDMYLVVILFDDLLASLDKNGIFFYTLVPVIRRDSIAFFRICRNIFIFNWIIFLNYNGWIFGHENFRIYIFLYCLQILQYSPGCIYPYPECFLLQQTNPRLKTGLTLIVPNELKRFLYKV